MKRSLWLAVLAACVVVAVAISQSEVTADSSSGADPAVQPPPGAAPPHDPLSPDDVGPPAAVWRYEDLGPEDQAAVDRGFETDTWGAGQQALAAAAAQQYPENAARRAQLLLGVSDLANAGVVP